MSAPESLNFRPSAHQTDSVLSALADQDLSFRAVAERFGTSTAALTAWLTRPDVQAHMDTMGTVAAGRARFLATNCLNSVIASAARMIDEFNAASPSRSQPRIAQPVAPALAPQAPAPAPDNAIQRYREKESIRRTGCLLFRLARFVPVPFNTQPRAPLSDVSKPSQPVAHARAEHPAPSHRAPQLMNPTPSATSAGPSAAPSTISPVPHGSWQSFGEGSLVEAIHPGVPDNKSRHNPPTRRTAQSLAGAAGAFPRAP